MSITLDCASWIGSPLTDRDDHRLGTIAAIHYDEQTGRPLWMVVKTGLFGTRRSFVPLARVMPRDDAIVAPYVRSQIDAAPRLDASDALSDDRVRALYRHYGVPDDGIADSGRPEAPTQTLADRVLQYVG